MGGEVKIILWFQGGSNTFFDYLMLALTQLGDELCFLIAAIILFWCVDKRYAFKFVNVFIGCSVVVNGVKMIFRRARPYDTYDGLVRSIGERTGGYSFPSGHSAGITNMSAQAYIKLRKTKAALYVLASGIAVSILVMISRMYLGQHYLTDVLAGAAIGIGFAALFSYLFELLGENEHKIFYVAVPVCVVLTVVLIACKVSGSEEIIKVCGGYAAFTLGYFLEKRFVRYDVKSGKAWKHIVKVLLGAAVAFGLKEGLKYVFPLDILFLSGFVRYMLVAAWAVLGAPAVFKALKI